MTRKLPNFLSNMLRRLRILLGENYAVLAWPIAAALITIVGWGILWDNLEADRKEAEAAALKQASALSRTYSDHVVRTVEAIDQILLHVRFEWALSKGTLSLAEMKRNNLFLASPMVFSTLINRDGYIVTNTTSDNFTEFVGDRDYFLFQKSSKEDLLYLGRPLIGRNLHRPVIPFSRRLVDDNGNFNGVIQFAIAPGFLTANYDATIFGQYGLLGVIGTDETIRETRVGQTVYFLAPQAFVSVPLLEKPSGSQLFEGSKWFLDKRSRYIGWHSARNYPVFALVGLDQAEIQAANVANRESTVRTGLYATATLVLFTLVATGLSMRLAWRKHQLAAAQATYRIATEEGKEGFYILSPMRNGTGYITDFKVMDCNQRGAEFFNCSRKNCIGTRISSLYQRPVRERLMRRLRHAEATGLYESEVRVPGDAAGSLRWMHLKALRSNDQLAVTARDITQEKTHVAELQRRSEEDVLTKLPNRQWLQNYLPKAVERAAANGMMLALLFIDLDGFKATNDSLGHSAGDELLCYVAQRLKIAVRPKDHVVRWGGDEFVVLVEHIVGRAAAAQVASRVLQAFGDSFHLRKGTRSVNGSIGISIFPADGTAADELLYNADVAMYSVKTAGKGHYRFFDPDYSETLRAKQQKEDELRHAIKSDQFVLYYQPRIDTATGSTVSMEALVRWAHPTQGILNPLEFISLAEDTGMILDLGELVIDKVCLQLSRWARHGQKLVPVSVNVSPRQFQEADIQKVFSEALNRYNVDPRLIEIEVTESSMMRDDMELSSTLNSIQEMGIKLCIDDFGTGYSSLSKLQQLDFDVLKIDRAFITQIDRTDEGTVFVKAIITMGHALGMRIVAEGVETQQQLSILKALQCDEIQGFYVSKPLPATEIQPISAKSFDPATT